MPCGPMSRGCWTLATASLAIVTALALAPAARGQFGDSVPSRIYFTGCTTYYDGDYRESLATFQAASRSGIKNAQSLWIDSICYYAMAGESYYQLGQFPAALQSYNTALKLYLTYSNWMMRVQFPPVIGPATVGVLRAAPWGQSRRGSRVGNFPDTFGMSQGQVDQSAVVFGGGGVVQSPVIFPVHVAEIVRCTSLAIRRRKELLGPLCKHDPLTNDLVESLSRRAGPPIHWSQAWINVQLGCAYAAAGNVAQATTTLQQALVVSGEFDHPLTSTALAELGQLSLEVGDFAAASRYFEEASYACVNFPNPGILEESFRFGLLAHLLLNQKTPYPPLVPAMAWAKAAGLRQLQASLLLSGAENMTMLGDTGQAVNLLTGARSLIGRSDLGISQLGARMNHLTAVASYQAGNVGAGDQALATALSFQQQGSLWMFQIGLADTRYLQGDYSDRVGLMLYEALLRDPAPVDWLSNPLECLSVLSIPHGVAFEHWFEGVMKHGKEQDLALEIADRTRRHRFFSTLPMGGRLLALRWILEGPPEIVGDKGLLQRQDLLLRYPKYHELAQQAATIRAGLAAKPPVAADAPARRDQSAELARLSEISESQEVILREIAVRREPAEMVFPPLRKTRDVQHAMREGQVLLAFFATGHNLYAFLYSSEKYAAWHIHSPAMLQKQIATLLREMGNFDSNHELAPTDLAKGSWRATAAKVMSLLLEKSNVDLAGNFEELVIVPDAGLWYLPFEALRIGKGDQDRPMISQIQVRYAPTVGLAVPSGRPAKARTNVGVMLGKLWPHDDEGTVTSAFEEIGRSVGGAVELPKTLPASTAIYRHLFDGLIVLDDVPGGDDPYAWLPAPTDRGKNGGSLAQWLALPFGGPDVLLLPGFHTAAENGLRRGQPTGNEMFLSLCGLLSTGTRTVLISRWRTGGQTSLGLVREFAQELPHVSPAQAWQRSVQVAINTQLEPEREPRLKKAPPGTEFANADHPFFWAGYMLVDSGVGNPGHDKAGGKHVIQANPPAAPLPPRPLVDVPDPMADPPAKPAKKSKVPPRTPAKKSVPRQKPQQPAADE